MLSFDRVGPRVVLLVVAVAAAGGLAGTLVLAQARDGGPSRAKAKDAPAGLVARPIARSVDPRVADRFSVLRRPRTASDVLSRSGRLVVDDPEIPNTSGSNADLARDSTAVAGARRIFVVPGDDSVCLVLEAEGAAGEQIAGGGCADLSIAASGRFVRSGYGGTFAGADRVLAYGLAPDGLSTVEIVDADGHGRSVPVKGNVYAAILQDRGPLTVRVGDDSVLVP
jgi:hypothetical protein